MNFGWSGHVSNGNSFPVNPHIRKIGRLMRGKRVTTKNHNPAYSRRGTRAEGKKPYAEAVRRYKAPKIYRLWAGMCDLFSQEAWK